MTGAGRAAGAITVLATMVALLASASAQAAAAGQPSIRAAGAMQPHFKLRARDYALHGCESKPRPSLSLQGAKGWRSSVDGSGMRRGSYAVRVRAAAGEAVTVRFERARTGKVRRYRLRCLPADFPGYRFERERAGGPKMFTMQMGDHYGAVFDRHGAPVWWVKADGEPDNFSVLADGTLTWAPVDDIRLQVGPIEVRSLRNRLLHKFPGAPGTTADVHDLILRRNGNYLIGAERIYDDDATAFGGGPASAIRGADIQEFTPAGDLAWSWSSEGHIDLAETGRWWDVSILDTEPYDVVHWNAVAEDGRDLLVSMRHDDAIYKIDRRSGKVVWKLGGTPTAKSLDVVGDPHGTGDGLFGGQHDIRVEPDGSITIHDNRTGLSGLPRAVRYRVNEDKGRARLVETVEDHDVPESFCCGSARRLAGGDWLIGWGGNGITAAYDDRGRRIFRLDLDVGFSYRSIPVPDGAVSKRKLRRAMNAMAR